jgi:transcription elongation GreA/GreB family factor
MDKQRVKQTMLELERQKFNASREAYLGFVSSAQLDRSEPIENDEQAQAEFAADLSEAFDQPVHAHADKIAKLQTIDFGPKETVEEGAIVKLMDRTFVIAVATDRFVCDGTELMGVSVEAPLFRALEGKSAGESCTFNGHRFVVDLVT